VCAAQIPSRHYDKVRRVALSRVSSCLVKDEIRLERHNRVCGGLVTNFVATISVCSRGEVSIKVGVMGFGLRASTSLLQFVLWIYRTACCTACCTSIRNKWSLGLKCHEVTVTRARARYGMVRYGKAHAHQYERTRQLLPDERGRQQTPDRGTADCPAML